MTEQHVATTMERSLGEHATYVHESVTQAIAKRLVGHRPARAVVIELDDLRTKVWGVCRRFTTVGSIEVYA